MRREAAVAAAIGMAVGLIGVGALSLAHQEFAQVWEPVPKAWPGRPLTPILSGLLLVGAGGLMLWRRTRGWGAAVAAGFLGLWVVALHLPNAARAPLVWGSWQAVGESTVMAAGAFIAWREAGGGRAPRAAIYLMGACYVVFGVSHFVYAKFTAAMIPAWLPAHMPLTWLTGAVHVLTGLALLIGVQRRWAAATEALMMSSFVVLANLPLLLRTPQDHEAQTGVFIATMLSAAAWLLATSRALDAKAD